MASVSLKAERPCLTVNFGDDEYKVPLTFTRDEYKDLGEREDEQDAAIFDFFRKYLGDIVDQIGDDDVIALIKAWRDARNELNGTNLGEA